MVKIIYKSDLNNFGSTKLQQEETTIKNLIGKDKQQPHKINIYAEILGRQLVWEYRFLKCFLFRNISK